MDESKQMVKNFRYYYLAIDKNQGGVFDHHDLNELKERHKVDLSPVDTKLPNDFIQEILQGKVNGVVIALHGGCPGFQELKCSRLFAKHNIAHWYFWPRENAIEYIDDSELVEVTPKNIRIRKIDLN